MTQPDQPTTPACESFLHTEANVDPISSSRRSKGRRPTTNTHPPAESEMLTKVPDSVFADLDAVQAGKLKGWPQFWILAIKIDAKTGGAAHNQLYECIDRILKRSENSQNNVLTPWQDGVCLYALADVDDNHVMSRARNLQSELALQRVETISIGISAFPLLNYSREESGLNAYKALDHAAFFGPGTITVFDAVSCNISGDKYYQIGQLDRAMDEYHAGLAMDPANANLLNSLGVCYAKCDNLQQAQNAFEDSLKHDPEEPFALYNLAAIQIINHDPESAFENLEKAFTLNTDTFQIPFQIGKILSKQGQYERALEYFETASNIRPENSTAFRFMGECLSATGEYPEAIAAFRQAARLNPNDAMTLSALGALYAATNENPEICMAFLKQSIAIDPDNGLFQHRLAQYYHERDDLNRALQAYEKAVDLGHDSHHQVSEVQERIDNSMGNSKQCSG